MNHSYLFVSNNKTDFEGVESWQRLLELTYAAWRVADLTVDNEILKNRIKQIALDILTQYSNILGGNEAVDFGKNINSQIALLSVAQKLSSSQGINFLVLKSEYKKFSSSNINHESINVESKDVSQAGNTQQESENAAAFNDGNGKKNHVIVSHNKNQNDSTNGNNLADLNIRQTKILQIFRKHKSDKIQLKDIIRFFPGSTDRTIRNDLRGLCGKKIILRLGKHGPASFYKLGKI